MLVFVASNISCRFGFVCVQVCVCYRLRCTMQISIWLLLDGLGGDREGEHGGCFSAGACFVDWW